MCQHPPIKQYIKKKYEEMPLVEVVLHVQKDKIRFLGEQKYYNGLVAQKGKGNFIEMTFMTTSLEGFASLRHTVKGIIEKRQLHCKFIHLSFIG